MLLRYQIYVLKAKASHQFSFLLYQIQNKIDNLSKRTSRKYMYMMYKCINIQSQSIFRLSPEVASSKQPVVIGVSL